MRSPTALNLKLKLTLLALASAVALSACQSMSAGQQAGLAGGCVLVGGGLTTWGVAESTSYNTDLRDDDGRLVPIAQQPEKNLIPVAVGIGAASAIIGGSLITIALLMESGIFDDDGLPEDAAGVGSNRPTDADDPLLDAANDDDTGDGDGENEAPEGDGSAVGDAPPMPEAPFAPEELQSEAREDPRAAPQAIP